MPKKSHLVHTAFFSGLRRMLGAPSLLLWLYLACFLVALPLTFTMGQILSESMGASLVEEKMRNGFDTVWWGEFEFQNRGLPETFGPWVVGHLLPVTHLERLLDGELFGIHPGVLLTGLLFVFLLTFLSGGILDRLARFDEPASRTGLFASGSRHFFRLLRLSLISVGLYWLLFQLIWQPVQEWLEWATRDFTAERPVLICTLLLYVLTGATLLALGMVFDYARIALVCERRRSAVLSLGRSLGHVLRRPLACAGLYLCLFSVSVLVVGLYLLVAPGPNQATLWSVGLAALVSQLYILARIATRVWFLAAQTELFQSAEEPRSDG